MPKPTVELEIPCDLSGNSVDCLENRGEESHRFKNDQNTNNNEIEDNMDDSISELSDDDCVNNTGKRNAINPRRWTEDEDIRLKQAVNMFGDMRWKVISEVVKTRDNIQCRQRWQKILHPGLHKGKWSPEEDELLRFLISVCGENWCVVAPRLPGRTSKQCRERWCHHLAPGVDKSPMTREEDVLLMNLHAKYENRWAKIASEMHGRTENMVRSRIQILKKALLLEKKTSVTELTSFYSRASCKTNKYQRESVAFTTSKQDIKSDYVPREITPVLNLEKDSTTASRLQPKDSQVPSASTTLCDESSFAFRASSRESSQRSAQALKSYDALNQNSIDLEASKVLSSIRGKIQNEEKVQASFNQNKPFGVLNDVGRQASITRDHFSLPRTTAPSEMSSAMQNLFWHPVFGLVSIIPAYGPVINQACFNVSPSSMNGSIINSSMTQNDYPLRAIYRPVSQRSSVDPL